MGKLSPVQRKRAAAMAAMCNIDPQVYFLQPVKTTVASIFFLEMPWLNSWVFFQKVVI